MGAKIEIILRGLESSLIGPLVLEKAETEIVLNNPRSLEDERRALDDIKKQYPDQKQSEDVLDPRDLRRWVLATLDKLSISPPFSDLSRLYARDTIDPLICQARTDNNYNAVLCWEVILDTILLESGQTKPRPYILIPILEDLFGLVEKAVGGAESKAVEWIKTLSECLMTSMSILAIFPQTMPNDNLFIPLIEAILCLRTEAQKTAESLDRACKDKANRPALAFTESSEAKVLDELTCSQAMGVFFLGLLFRRDPKKRLVKSQEVKGLLLSLSKNVIRIFIDCRELDSRRRLTAGCRYILNDSTIKIFLPHFDDLLDRRVLIGESFTADRTLSLSAYSMVTDIISRSKQDIRSDTIVKALVWCTSNLLKADDYDGTALELLSANLLLDMTQYAAKQLEKDEAQNVMSIAVGAIVDRLAAKNKQHPNRVKLSDVNDRLPFCKFLAGPSGPPNWDETDIFAPGPIILDLKVRSSNDLSDNAFVLERLRPVLNEYVDWLETLAVDKPSRGVPEILLKALSEIASILSYSTLNDEEMAKYLDTFQKICQCIPTVELLKKLPWLEDMARQYPAQAFLQSAVKALEAFRADMQASRLEELADHPKEFWEYLKGNIGKANCRDLITQIKMSREALINCGIGLVGDLIKACAQGKNNNIAARIDTVNVIATLCRERRGEWKIQAKHLRVLQDIVERLGLDLRADRIPLELRLAARQVNEELLEIFAKGLERTPENHLVEMSLLDAFERGSLVVSPATLREYIYRCIISTSSEAFLHDVVTRCLDICVYENASARKMTFLLHNIIKPAVAMDIERHWTGDEASTVNILPEAALFIAAIWNRVMEQDSQPCKGHVLIEVLQLLNLLLKYRPESLRSDINDLLGTIFTRYPSNEPIIEHAIFVTVMNCFAIQKTTVCRTTEGTSISAEVIYSRILRNRRYSDEVLVLDLQALSAAAPVIAEQVHVAIMREALITTVGTYVTTPLHFLISQSEIFQHSQDEIIGPLLNYLRAFVAAASSKFELKLAVDTMSWIRENWSVIARCHERLVECIVELITKLPGHCKFPLAKGMGKTLDAMNIPPRDLHERSMELLSVFIQPQGGVSPDIAFPKSIVLDFSSIEACAKYAMIRKQLEKRPMKRLGGPPLKLEGDKTDQLINTFQALCILIRSSPDSWVNKYGSKIKKILGACQNSKLSDLQEQVRAAEEFGIFDRIRSVNCIDQDFPEFVMVPPSAHT